MNNKVIPYLVQHIELSPERIRDITSSLYHTVPAFDTELSLFYKQEAFGPDLRSFQLLCYLDRTFVGYSYMQSFRSELRLTINDILYHPGSYQWYLADSSYSFARVRELNAQGYHALYVEPRFRRTEPGAQATGFGALLLRTSLCIAQHTAPWTERFKLQTYRHRLPFYEQNLHFRDRLSFFCAGDIMLSLPFKRIMADLDRTVVLKQYRPFTATMDTHP